MRAVLVLALCITLAFAGNWTVQSPDLAPILDGVSFVDSQHGWLSGGADNVGSEVLYTKNGGQHWQRAKEGGTSLLFLDIAMQSMTSGVVSGVGILTISGMEYTTNGTTFLPSKEVELESESQSVEGIMGVKTGYGVTGQFGKSNGVAISGNGGQTFTMYDCGLNNETYMTRYGSFPSASTWYLSAGTWPANAAQRARGKVEGFRQKSQRISLHMDPVTKQVKPVFDFSVMKKKPRAPQDNNGYYAAITKSTDGGKTWTQVFNNVNNYYPNAISCPTVNDCWFVAESGGDSDQPGANIIATNDGGKTWKTQFTNSDPNYSLMAINMISATEGWAAGGILDATFDGEWLHTSNGGATWTANIVRGVYGNDLSFVKTSGSNYVGWATAFTVTSLSSVVQYK